MKWSSAAVCLATALLEPAQPAWPHHIPNSYDREIQQAVKRWWPDVPYWNLWKAQLYQESRLEAGAVSRAGARGLAQFMPGTWRDVRADLRIASSPHSVDAIDAGAYYMAKLRRIWKAERTALERNELAQASYNAGAGHILKAQRLCGNARLWMTVKACLARVTGPGNAHETRTYVDRIARWWKHLEVSG